jgi:hypothetical protein
MIIHTVRPLRRLVLALGLLLGLAVVGLTAPAAAAAWTSADVDAVPPGKTPVATRVVLERTGGINGQPLTIVVDAGGAHPDVPRLLRMASSPEFLALKPSYLPEDTCCDFFFYKVTVTYINDAKKSVLTMEGVAVPTVLSDVIGLTLAIGGNSA